MPTWFNLKPLYCLFSEETRFFLSWKCRPCVSFFWHLFSSNDIWSTVQKRRYESLWYRKTQVSRSLDCGKFAGRKEKTSKEAKCVVETLRKWRIRISVSQEQTTAKRLYCTDRKGLETLASLFLSTKKRSRVSQNRATNNVTEIRAKIETNYEYLSTRSIGE